MPGGRQFLIFRAGLTIGTASDSLGGFASNQIVSYARLTDTIDYAPKATAGRLSASVFQQFSFVFVRADLGLDIAFSTKSSSDVYVHANAALGLRVPYVDLTGELVNAGAVDGNDDFTDRFHHTFALMMRTRGQNLLHLGSILPLDSAVRGEQWIVSLGYQRGF